MKFNQLTASIIVTLSISDPIAAADVKPLVEHQQEALKSTAVAIKTDSIQTTKDISAFALALNSNGRLLAARTSRQNVDVWDLESKDAIKTLTLPDGAVDVVNSVPLQFSSDDEYLISCHTRTATSVASTFWNTKKSFIQKEIKDSLPGSGCAAIAESRNSRQFVRFLSRPAYRPGPTIIMYDHALDKSTKEVRTTPLDIRTVVPNPAGRLFLVVGTMIRPSQNIVSGAPEFSNLGAPGEAVMAIMDGSTLKPLAWRPVESVIYPFPSIAWCKTSDQIYYAAGQRLQIMRAPELELIADFREPNGLSYAKIGCAGVGRYLLELHQGKSQAQVQVWDARHTKLLQTIMGNYRDFTVSGDGKTMVLSRKGAIDVLKIN